MLKTAVCDDIPLHLKKAEELVDQYMKKRNIRCSITPFSSADDLLLSISEEDYRPDIAVLDIEMPDGSGLELARKINECLPGCRIIFLTAYMNYAPDAYLTDHVWFVTKNRVQEYMEPALDRALKSLEKSDAASEGLIVHEAGKSRFIPLSEILYISKVARKSVVYCTEDRKYSDTRRPAVLIPEKLKNDFLQCHQGYWVNLKMIRELDHSSFILINGQSIPISRSFRDASRKRFFEKFHL